MPYRFAVEDADYLDYASGRVLYNAPGQPALPVRLTSEIFQRCMAIRRVGSPGSPTPPVRVYDPCCGAAYHLAVLACLHRPEIASITASDVDAAVLGTATRNLSLLTPGGLQNRINEIRRMAAEFGKDSHQEALKSAERLMDRLRAHVSRRPIATCVFQANALDPQDLSQNLAGEAFDLLLSDVPYENLSRWQVPDGLAGSGKEPLWHLLNALLPFLAENALIAIASDKKQKIRHERYVRADHFQIGRRKVEILKLIR